VTGHLPRSTQEHDAHTKVAIFMSVTPPTSVTPQSANKGDPLQGRAPSGAQSVRISSCPTRLKSAIGGNIYPALE
jgi:hypothetical protein